jgi:uncharacterized protein (DUF1778 family)
MTGEGVRQLASLQSANFLDVYGVLPYIFEGKERPMSPSSPRKRAPRELKNERIELRVAASAKELIQRAMTVSGLTAGDLAYEGARRVLDEHQRMTLSGADRDAFLDAVRNPPEPTEKLISALRRHRQLMG